jgi:hypothetical protein
MWVPELSESPSASVREPLQAAFLITIEDLIAGLAEMPNSLQRSAIASPASHKLQSLIHHRTLLPRHHSLPSTGRKCHLCVRYNVY